MTEIPRSYRSFAQIAICLLYTTYSAFEQPKSECCSDLNLFAEIPYHQAKHSVDMDLYLNEKDIKNIKIFDKKCECYEWFKIC